MVNKSACNLRKPVYMVQYIQTRHSVELQAELAGPSKALTACAS